MYQTFQIDQEDQPQIQKSSPYKFTDKYSNVLKPNFIVSEQDDYHQQLSSAPILKQSLIKQDEPQKNPKNMNNIPKAQELHPDKLYKIKKQREEIQDSQFVEKKEPIITQSKEELARPSLKDNILFLYEDDEEEIVQESEPQNIQIPTREIGQIYGLDLDSDAQNQVETIVVNKASQYFQALSRQILSRQLVTCVEKSHVLKLELKRQNSGLNLLWPQYELSFKNEPGICFAKRTTARPIATYLFSLCPKEFDQQKQSYMGKLKTNIIGNILYIYGPGLNPKNAEQKHVAPREMLATIVYQTSFMNQTKPRAFTVYVKHPDKGYYSLKGAKGGQQIGLDELFLASQENRQNIAIYQNSKPAWNQKVGGFMLNFKGRVREASVKNFILQDMLFNQVMMFGKMGQNVFAIEVKDRFSPLVAFGIALSAFDSKFLCQ